MATPVPQATTPELRVTDTRGNSYVLKINQVDIAQDANGLWTSYNVAHALVSGDHITFTPDTALITGQALIAFYRTDAITTADPYDAHASADGTGYSNAASGATGTTAQAHEATIGVIFFYNNNHQPTFSAGSGWAALTTLQWTNDLGKFSGICPEWQDLEGTSTVNATGTFSGSGGTHYWGAMAATFKLAVVANMAATSTTLSPQTSLSALAAHNRSILTSPSPNYPSFVTNVGTGSFSNAAGQTSFTISAAAVAQGKTIAVLVDVHTVESSSVYVTDSRGNTYAYMNFGSYTGPGGLNQNVVFVAQNIATALQSGDLITITIVNGATIGLATAAAFSGTSIAIVDAGSKNFGSGTSPDSGITGTTIREVEIALGVVEVSSTGTPTFSNPSSGWNALSSVSVVLSGTTYAWFPYYQILDSYGTVELSGISGGTSPSWVATVLTFPAGNAEPSTTISTVRETYGALSTNLTPSTILSAVGAHYKSLLTSLTPSTVLATIATHVQAILTSLLPSTSLVGGTAKSTTIMTSLTPSTVLAALRETYGALSTNLTPSTILSAVGAHYKSLLTSLTPSTVLATIATHVQAILTSLLPSTSLVGGTAKSTTIMTSLTPSTVLAALRETYGALSTNLTPSTILSAVGAHYKSLLTSLTPSTVLATIATHVQAILTSLLPSTSLVGGTAKSTTIMTSLTPSTVLAALRETYGALSTNLTPSTILSAVGAHYKSLLTSLTPSTVLATIATHVQAILTSLLPSTSLVGGTAKSTTIMTSLTPSTVLAALRETYGALSTNLTPSTILSGRWGSLQIPADKPDALDGAGHNSHSRSGHSYLPPAVYKPCRRDG